MYFVIFRYNLQSDHFLPYHFTSPHSCPPHHPPKDYFIPIRLPVTSCLFTDKKSVPAFVKFDIGGGGGNFPTAMSLALHIVNTTGFANIRRIDVRERSRRGKFWG